MRKLLLTLLFWLVPTIAFGQSTTVSGTVIDLDGQQWTAGTVVASFVPAQGTTLGQYTWSGGAFNPGASITISITAGGNYTQAIPSSTAIVPAGSKWTFTANSGTTSLNTQSQTVTVTGGSQTLNFAPAAIRITAAPGAVAYADAEVAATVGQSYYNLTSSAIRVCTTATGAVCSVWVAGGGGITNVSVAPSGACTPNGSTQILNVTPVQIYKCVAGFWQPDFSLVIDSKAYGVKADGKFCFGTFLTTAGSSTNISCVSTLTTITASVAGNVATLSFYGNPLTVGAVPWAAGNSVIIAGFLGGDTYFNGTFTLSTVTASTITFALVHANASATSNGEVANSNVGYFSAADIGKIIFATNGGGGVLNSQAGILTCPQSTISSVTNSVTAVTGIACTNTSNVLVWGSDDTAALDITSAILANINGCGTVLLPQGITLTSHGQWQLDSPACVSATTSSLSVAYGAGARVLGWGPAVSIVVPVPTFNFQTLNTGSIFGSPNFMMYENWSIYGAGLGTNGNNSVSIVKMNTESTAYNFEIVAWLGADTNTIGLTMNGRLNTVRVQGAGGTGCVTSGTVYAVNVVCNYSKSRALNISSRLQAINSSFGGNTAGVVSILISNGGTYNSMHNDDGFSTTSPTNNIAVQVQIGGVYNVDRGVVGNTSASTCVGLYNAGGVVHAHLTSFVGCTSGNAVQQDQSAKFFDDGGNTYTGSTVLLLDNSTVSFIPFKSLTGTCTGVVTASQTLGLYGTGPNETLTTCTSTTIGSGQVMDHAGTLQFLHVSSGAVGVNASSGVVTVLKNGAGTTITCTIGTGTFCLDGQHTVSFATGDLISMNFTTQAADTLAGVKAFVELY